MMRKSASIWLLALLSACSLHKEQAQEKESYSVSNFQSIAFGESGGVTGAGRNYILESNAVLYEYDKNWNKTPVDTLRAQRMRRIDSLAQNVLILNEIRHEPGNMNYNLSIESALVNKTYKWSKPGQEVPRLLEDYYSLLIESLSE